MEHGAITLQESFMVNKKHVPQFRFSGTHEGFVYNLDFHLWLRQFPPGHTHEQRGQYQAKCKKNHCDSSETNCAQTANIKFSIRRHLNKTRHRNANYVAGNLCILQWTLLPFLICPPPTSIGWNHPQAPPTIHNVSCDWSHVKLIPKINASSPKIPQM